jgi:hypothetical protein
MATEDDKWPRLLAKLIADTRDRSVRWKAVPVGAARDNSGPSTLGISTNVASYFADLGDRGFRLDVGEVRGGFFAGATQTLSIAMPDGRAIKKLPIRAGLVDLQRAIEDQIAQVDEFIENYLKR